MGPPGPLVEFLIFGQGGNTSHGAVQRQLESVRGRLHRRLDISKHFLAADTAAGLADKTFPLEQMTDLFPPLSSQPDINDVGVQVHIIPDGPDILWPAHQAFPQTEPGCVPDLVARGSHHH